ncbi:hypothetical protein C7T94_16280 [Pedobacter yulinensis]|uniref:Uncharacterized protein n=1 Tax=Pedobacter yulinensis TaxID=2126353 RepID=A0A2T3HIS6_9SPHI|nr:hypothetical protein [Pedobacter yulinensis]PST82337.1 hypothetical protein C7T94_16280 [Pedobacter yulinensis]
MKILKNFLRTAALIALIGSGQACKKNNTGNQDSEFKYTYQNKTVALAGGTYLLADGQAHLFLEPAGVHGAVHFIFSNSNKIPTGTYSLNGNSSTPTNFVAGSLGSSEASPLGDAMTGGKVTIERSGGGYAVSFDVNTAKGNAKGDFTGNFKAR